MDREGVGVYGSIADSAMPAGNDEGGEGLTEERHGLFALADVGDGPRGSIGVFGVRLGERLDRELGSEGPESEGEGGGDVEGLGGEGT